MSNLIPIKLFGLNKDIDPSDLNASDRKLDAYTDSYNMYFDDRKAIKSKGHSQVFGALSLQPVKLLPVLTTTASYWIYAGLTGVYVTDSTTHTDITPASGATSTTIINRWTSCFLNGVPILNNKTNTPIWWDGVVANAMTDITGWVSGEKCNVLRSYKNYLFALNVEISGVRYNNKLKWSSAANPGSLPSTWVPAATNDAGSNTLSETPDEIIDGLTLRDEFLIYKQTSIHSCQYIGGRYVFKFRELFAGSFGCIAEGCVVEFDNKHAVLTNGDFIVHDGNTFDSKIDFKMRKWLFSQINNDYIDTCFLSLDYPKDEILICYPAGASEIPNKVLVYNYREDEFYPKDLPETYDIENGVVVPVAVDDSWDHETTITWESDSTIWDSKLYSATNDSVLIAGYTDTKIYHIDETETYDGVNFSSYVEKDTMAIGKKAELKTLNELWPNLTGSIGKVINIRIGTQMIQSDSISWSSVKQFTIGSQEKIDFFATGRYFSFKFESTDEYSWGIIDFQVNVVGGGKY